MFIQNMTYSKKTIFASKILNLISKIKAFPKKVKCLQPLESGSAMDASGTELLGRFAREAQEGHGPDLLID